MSWVIDGISLLVLIIFAVASYHKGFLYTVVRLGGTVAALLFSFYYSQPVAELVYSRFLEGWATEAVRNNIGLLRTADYSSFVQSVQEMLADMPSAIGTLLQNSIGNSMQQWYETLSQADPTLAAGVIVDMAVQPVLTGAARVAVFCLMFFVLMLLVTTLAGLMKTVNYIPLIGSFNEMLGGILGLAQGMLYLFVIAAAVWFLLSAAGGSFAGLSEETVQQTLLFRWFYQAGPWTKQLAPTL